MDNCLICNSKWSLRDKIKVQDFNYLICTNCTGMTLVPRDKALHKIRTMYDESGYFDWRNPSWIKRILFGIKFCPSYSQWVNSFGASKDLSVLDVGAGIPTFLIQMKSLGWKVYAQEIASEQVKMIAKSIGRKQVFKGDFEKLKLPKLNFDALTFWHVLEHVKYPIKTMIKSHSLLKKRGFIFIEVPNSNTWTWKIFKSNYSFIRVPDHLFYYNKKSFNALFLQSGFKIIAINYPVRFISTFSASLVEALKPKIHNQTLLLMIYYLTLPLSLIFSILASLFGGTEVIRVTVQKKNS